MVPHKLDFTMIHKTKSEK